MRWAYNTNGLQSHRLDDALGLLADAGYEGVALTLDHMHLDPVRAGPGEVAAVARQLRRLRLSCAVETGARFVLDPRRKHGPGLCDPDPLGRLQRLDLLKRSLEIASELGAEVLNLPAGPRDGPRDGGPREGPAADPAREAAAGTWLLEALRELLERGLELGLRVALEPEPGHWVATLAQHAALREQLPELGLTLDVSHVSVTEPEGAPAEAIRAHAEALTLVHLEDAPRGVHQHLPFGEGELDLSAVVRALHEVRFGGLCAVELSRHSHAAHELVPRTLATLRAAEEGLQA
ncbi:MAG: sugar phosphate isomerase/epimerase family protein [Planctomycetota bacterium]